MEILGVGMSELIFIVIIALIVLGPKDMQKAGKTIGKWLNQFIHSDIWKTVNKTSAEIRNLPRNLMREANMELSLTKEELNKSAGKNAQISQSIRNSSRPIDTSENRISPSPEEPKENESDQQNNA